MQAIKPRMTNMRRVPGEVRSHAPKMQVIGIVFLLLSSTMGGALLAQDPANIGPYVVVERSYNDGDSVFRPTGFPINVEVRAQVHHPANMSLGPFPLVVFLHGRHETCFSGSSGVLQWPCTSGRQPIPSFEGYEYLAELLASHGFIVVSISANGINARDNNVGDLGMLARAELIQRHLQKWQTWNTTGGSPFGSLFVGRVDLQNIGTMGHSRGGEGVVRHFELNRSQGSPFGVQAVLPLAPTNFNRTIANRVALGVMLPYCDGDVSDLQGVHFYDDARYNVPGDAAFKHTFLMMGSNHNFFNTVWTPGLFPAAAIDDWLAPWLPDLSGDPHCGPSASSRLSATEQRGAASTFITGFFRRYLAAETSYMPLLTSNVSLPLSAQGADVRVSYHAPDLSNMRRDVNRMLADSNRSTNTLGGSVTSSGLSPHRVCGGNSPQPSRCLSSSNNVAREPHTTPSLLASSTRGLSQLEVGWSSTSARWTNNLPSGQRNVSGYGYLTFRTGVDFTDSRNTSGSAQNFSVRLTDGVGGTRTVSAASYSKALYYPPGSLTLVPKLFLNTVRIPLSAFSGVNRSDVRTIDFLFDRKTLGSVMITDLAFSNTETPTSTPCCNGPISEREIYLIGDTRWALSGNSVSYCATGTVQPTSIGGYCHVAYDAVENEWEFVTEDANCLFQCIWRPSGCSTITPATFTREYTLIESTGTKSEQLTFDDSLFSICATAGVVPLTTGGYCYVNNDGDDDTWELIARGASCNFSCIPQAATCATDSSREILLGSSGSIVLDDGPYPYCGTGGAIPKANGTGYCQNNHDGDDDTWELQSYGADFCNYFCLRD